MLGAYDIYRAGWCEKTEYGADCDRRHCIQCAHASGNCNAYVVFPAKTMSRVSWLLLPDNVWQEAGIYAAGYSKGRK